MDDSMLSLEPHYRKDGFDGQRLCVVPRPQVDAALSRQVTRRLTVTDVGYFPHASGHRISRPQGSRETIVLLCVTGTGIAVIGDETHLVGPSSALIIPAETPHQYQASVDDPWTIWWLHVRGRDVAELSPAAVSASDAHRVVRLRSVERSVALFDELVSMLERRLSPLQLVAASGLATHLLTQLATDSVLPADGSALERAMRYLEARADGNIQVAELAAMVGMSPSHLSALFRRATGGGPGAFRTSLRMARARALLDTTTMTITEVASTIGYIDPLYFSRQFRRVHGVSPSTYRAEHKA